ncbi:MAG: hypothetical protein ACYT04_91815, partial [Nostoc sp.]
CKGSACCLRISKRGQPNVEDYNRCERINIISRSTIANLRFNENNVYGWLHLRDLEFLVISQPPSYGDHILSDIIKPSPSPRFGIRGARISKSLSQIWERDLG